MNLEDLLTKDDLKTIRSIIATEVAKIVPATDSPYMLLSKAAEYIKEKPRTLREKAKNGEIAHIRDGSLYKFEKSDLDKYMRARKIKSNDEINSMAAARI